MDIPDDMISKGHQPDAVTSSTLIDGLCSKGEIEKAMDFVHDMIPKWHERDDWTYSILKAFLGPDAS